MIETVHWQVLYVQHIYTGTMQNSLYFTISWVFWIREKIP